MSQMHITVSGNLTSDPTILRFDSDKYLTKFRVASSRRYRTGEVDANNRPIWQETDNLFLDVEVWGQLAVNARASLFKGAPVLLAGSLVTDSWEDASELDADGKAATRQKLVLKAYRIAFDLSTYQVSSMKSTNQSNTPEGMKQVVLKTGEELAPETTPTRASAEDMVASAQERAYAEAGANAGSKEAPF